MAKITSLAELTDVASDDLLVVVDKSDTSMADSGTDKKVQKSNLLKGLVPENGWIPAGETWTYASADDPTYTFTISGDKTSKYSAGMKIKLTQTTVKYFIITKVAYSSPNTTITVYGGTDYDLTSGAITNPYYSMVKAPLGFPMSPVKWTVTIDPYTGISSQSNPVKNTVYNLGGSLSVPIGCWVLRYDINAYVEAASAAFIGAYIGWSTTTNSFTEDESKTFFFTNNTIGIGQMEGQVVVNLTSKTTYYVNMQAAYDNMTMIRTGWNCGCRRYAVCAYL